MEFEGKTALITGAVRGIGRAVALNLAHAGADIAAVYQKNQEKAAELVNEIEALGRRCLSLQANVAVEDEVDAAVNATLETFGRIDILINNAGITRDTLILRMKGGDWRDVIDVNLSGMFYCVKAVTKPMFKQRRGKIVFISSIIAATGNAGQANYAASKAGTIGLMKSVAKEFAGRGIQVNAVAPGFIDTDMTSSLQEDLRKHYMEQIPLKRFGTADDVAETVRFLVSEKADYITGQLIHVNGGLYM
ncbi:3-oxoacyl-[acyl-carrier-protein] reductase [candidate division KSB3 bacterium]|uniref:3-oxoacyl-[acyl-carrier-protein] reductase n=1 Tax=candidate division KSB3 bacterium TaxID=2044937 RepID=A0A2G6EA46_9BACT|nr:MAG: 3-oxoacyl-[acyl-carrier-protein] reductase [candidate division KSB3 bacterium]PIE30964.1 MAG: 3-oxoacyl-[acyl-carrier-protein] reductase [candidate division KSB3 bacterium]